MSGRVPARAPGVALAALVAVGASLLGISSCTGGDSSSGASGTTPDASPAPCPDDVPAACPPLPPTYAKDVAPLVQTACATCHRRGGRESSRLLTDYDQLFAQRGPVLNQVSACRMPPRDGPSLSVEDRRALVTWLVCGAKND